MKNTRFVLDKLERFRDRILNVDLEQLLAATKLISSISDSGGQLFVVGNGGSAAIASHVTIDLTKAAGIRASNFNDASLLTCFSNDYGYEWWVEKALEAHATDRDLLILISSSGQSENILNGAKYANENNIPLITFSGFSTDNPLKRLGKINFWVNDTQYNIVELTHHAWLLAIIDSLVCTVDSPD